MKSARGDRASTGVPGLDDVLGGGLPRLGVFLLQGAPGVGKTTLALQFLLHGEELGEKGMYVALTESKREVHSVARSHHWALDALSICELAGTTPQPKSQAEQTLFHPAEVELDELTRPMFAEIEEARPERVVIDSVSEIRFLAREPLRYRKQLIDLKNFFLDKHCTVLLVDTSSGGATDSGGLLESLIGGLILLEKTTPSYGSTRRRLVVDKIRGVPFQEGFHDYKIKTGGIRVYPRLVATGQNSSFTRDAVVSDIPELDTLTGGGLERGTSTLIIGAAGTGKSSLATQYALAAAKRKEKAVIYAFEETLGTWMARTTALGFDVQPFLDSDLIRLVHVDAAELSPGEFANSVRTNVEQDDARLIVVDSLNGYLQSVPEEAFLALHLHELLTFLAQKGTTTILNLAQHGLLGPAMAAPVDVSYLADAVLLLRYFEAAGEVRQAISVVKKRSGRHERTIREFRLDQGGVRVGRPLREFRGVLTGVPAYAGSVEPLLETRE